MVANQKNGNCFFIRFEDVTSQIEPKGEVLTVDKSHKSDFFNLVSRFGLQLTTCDGSTFAVKPAENESPENLAMHISTWDIVFHQFFAYNNDFWRANAEHHRKVAAKVITIQFPAEEKAEKSAIVAMG